MATHPPLKDRIMVLLPHFDGQFPALTEQELDKNRLAAGLTQAPGATMLTHERSGTHVGEVVCAPDELLDVIGAPLSEHVALVRRMLDRLPAVILEAVHEPFGARALVYVLLLHREGDLCEKQMGWLGTHADKLVFQETRRLMVYRDDLPPEVRLPLVDLCQAALCALSPGQYDAFRANVLALSNADQQVTLFEYTLRYVLIRHLDARFRKPRRNPTRFHSISRLKKECAVILSMLARHGHEVESVREEAFEAARQHLSIADHLALLPGKKCTLDHFHDALDKLAQLAFLHKKELLVACMASMAFDQRLTVTEAELFRGISGALECPVPPWLQLQSLKDA